MSAWELPTLLTVNGKEYAIRTDYRVVLDVLSALNDPDLFEPDASEQEKSIVTYLVLLEILYEDFETIPSEDWEEAAVRASEFIDCGFRDDGKRKTKLMDWKQDANIMIPALNKVAGKDIRSVAYMHWWSFVGLYMEIGESMFTYIISIRQKKAKHRKLEKWELEFYNENKEVIDLKRELSEEELEEQKELEEFVKKWGG